MTPEKLLEAMTDIDSSVIEEAKQALPRRSVRRITTVLVAAAVLMTMTITAFAAMSGTDWFKNFFAKQGDSELSDSQNAYIEENTQNPSLSQTIDGYTITVDSAITDGYTAYIKLLFQAPEGTVLDAEGYFNTIEIDKPYFYPVEGSDTSLSSGSWTMLDDGNTQDNRVSILIIRRGTGFTGGKVWRLELTDMEASYPYPQESEIIAEGTWCFDISFTDVSNEEVELLTEPLPHQAKIYSSATEYDYIDIQLTSVILRPMSGTILMDGLKDSYRAAGFGQITVVMKDGSTAKLNLSSGGNGRNDYATNVPIVLDEVDHLLLPDGTKLMMP